MSAIDLTQRLTPARRGLNHNTPAAREEARQERKMTKLIRRQPSVWHCRIGPGAPRADGADLPMRNAVRRAFIDVVGEEPAAIFSGWGEHFCESEVAAIENGMPDEDMVQVETLNKIRHLIRCLPRRGVLPKVLEEWAHGEPISA